jgi:hypothetical protein
MSRTKNYALFILGIASALGIAWLIRRQRQETSNLHVWQRVLTEHHGPEKANELINAVRQRQTALIAEAQMPENQVLCWHLQANILPGLALYRVLLQEQDGNQQAALADVDEALRAWTLAKNRLLLAPLNIFPAPFRVFKLVFAQMMKKFPVDGWDFTFVENNKDKVAFNATRCFYLSTLTASGAPELTASFCKTDEVMAELFPPSIRFVRPHTLGRGDAVCDFQYCRVQKP